MIILSITWCLNVWLSEWKYIWNTFSVQVIDFDYSIPSSKAPFKRNITAVLFNFNFLKSWKLIFSGFNSFAECKGLYFYEHWWLGHLFCFLSLSSRAPGDTLDLTSPKNSRMRLGNLSTKSNSQQIKVQMLFIAGYSLLYQSKGLFTLRTCFKTN